LNALAGCTGVDVVSLLNKMRVKFTDFSIEVSGTLTEEHPKVYHTIVVNYKIKVADTDRDKVEKAVKLSKEKYCGVSIMLGKAAKLESQIIFL
jgi:putative redox protein